MQVMPETSLQLGFEEYEEPKDNIHVGAYYLKYLENKFNKFDLDTLEQIKFTLAAYNAGLGHVLDAIRLAESYGKTQKYGTTTWIISSSTNPNRRYTGILSSASAIVTGNKHSTSSTILWKTILIIKTQSKIILNFKSKNSE